MWKLPTCCLICTAVRQTVTKRLSFRTKPCQVAMPIYCASHAVRLTPFFFPQRPLKLRFSLSYYKLFYTHAEPGLWTDLLQKAISPQLADGAKRLLKCPPHLSARWVNKMEPAALKGLFKKESQRNMTAPFYCNAALRHSLSLGCCFL